MTTVLYVNTFKGYAYGKNLANISISLPMKMQISRSPGINGEFSTGSLLGARTVTLEGIIASSTSTAEDTLGFRAALDIFSAAHSEGAAGLFYQHSDRFLNAEIQSIVYAKDEGFNHQAYTAVLYCADPFWYSDTLHNVALSIGNNAVTLLGTREFNPVISFTVIGSANGANQLIFTDDRANACKITPVVNQNGLYVVDSALKRITLDGIDASYCFSGSFLEVSAGGSVTLANTGLNISSPSMAYRDRWV